MPDDEKRVVRPALRLVSDGFLHDEKSGSTFQMGLFPKSDPLILSFFHVGFLKQSGLMTTTLEIDPFLFIDVRVVPSFRFLDLDREETLRFLEERSVNYVDVAGLIGASRLRLTNSSSAVQFISNFFDGAALSRPAMLVFDDFRLMSVMAEQLTNSLRERLKVNFISQIFVGERAWR